MVRGETAMSRKRVVRLVLVLGAAAAGAGWLCLVANNGARQTLTDLLRWIDGLGAWAPVAVAAIYVPATVLLVPGSMITLGAGFLCGLVRGTVAVSVGSTVGATAAFLVGRTFARGWVQQRVAGSPRFAALDRAVEREGFKIVLLVRLSPVFPFNVVNYVFGLTRVRLRDYVLASWIGMLPGGVMYVYLGTAAKSLAELAAGQAEADGLRQGFFFFGLACTVAATLFITRLARRTLREEVMRGESNEG